MEPRQPVWIQDRYQAVAPLGQERSGRVWKVRDLVSGDAVALTVLGASGPGAPDRFRGRFSDVAGLRHPNMVVICDLGRV